MLSARIGQCEWVPDPDRLSGPHIGRPSGGRGAILNMFNCPTPPVSHARSSPMPDHPPSAIAQSASAPGSRDIFQHVATRRLD